MQNYYKHSIGWILYSVFLFVAFNLFTELPEAIVRTLVVVVTQLIVFYVNLKWLLPGLYEIKNYILYGIINLSLLVIGVFLNNYLILLIPNPDYYEEETMEELGILDLELMFTDAMPIVLAIFISFFFHAFQKRKEQDEKELAIVTAEKNFLVQQINPHFLFNTLNNIYFLTYKAAPKGAGAIMQLSKMLDYSLYGGKDGNVSLENEIAHINNFISLYKLKDSEITRIIFNYSEADILLKIAPMILLPFVENAFKHGNIEDTTNGFITIELNSEGNTIRFNCTNSNIAKKNVDKTGGGGIGIMNVSRRLELVYPKRHQLNIDNSEKMYSVTLKIDANV